MKHNQSGTIDSGSFYLPNLENGENLDCLLFHESLGKRRIFSLISYAISAHLLTCGPGSMHSRDLVLERVVLGIETQLNMYPQKDAHDYCLLPLI